MGRHSGYTFQDELIFIQRLGKWSDANRQPSDALVAGYVRGVLQRRVGFEDDVTPLTREQLRRINEEVLALCRRLGLSATIAHVVLYELQ